LLALSRACTHLRCTLPWNDAFTFHSPYNAKPTKGWFRCACHGSTYTKAGVRVFGPAPRSVDTLGIRIRRDGSVVVDTRDVREGAIDNPLRATRVDLKV
jgi:cytochrome b6-f complex iron-sulfur subunit